MTSKTKRKYVRGPASLGMKNLKKTKDREGKEGCWGETCFGTQFFCILFFNKSELISSLKT